MEFDEIVVKESPGLCRCCLSEGCYKDMGTEYTWMNENEVYADMLLECFDIGISQHNDGPNGPNRLICEVCITRLRDACNFKKQVLDSEKKFVDMVGRGEFRPKVLIYQSQMKSEANEETAGEDAEVEYLEEIDFGDDDEPLKNEPSASEIAVEPLPVSKRGRPRKTLKAEKKKPKVDERPKTSKALVKGDASPTDVDRPAIKVRSMKLSRAEKNETLREAAHKKISRNSAVAFIHSANVCPFKFNRYFICIYCPSRFLDMPELAEHVKVEHKRVTEKDIRRAISKTSFCEPIKVNLSDYGCKLCNEKILSFEHLKHHLIGVHEKRIDPDNDGVLPFKITENEFICVLCGIKLGQYLYLCRHINEHYKKLVCNLCGAGFASDYRLRRHTMSHEEGCYPCEECGKVFNNIEKKRNHVLRVHMRVKRNKCMYCEETFSDYVQKQKHLLTHGMKQREYKCGFCSKVFFKSSTLRVHERQKHLQMETYSCNICGYECFDRNQLRPHMKRHTGERNHTCQVCGKSFARFYTLSDHMRIHSNDRRFACHHCDRAFIQKSGLKAHIRTNHKEFQM